MAKANLRLAQYEQWKDKPVVLIFGDSPHRPTSVLTNPESQPISISIKMNFGALTLEEAERLYANLGNAINLLREPNPKTGLIGANDEVYINGKQVEHLF